MRQSGTSTPRRDLHDGLAVWHESPRPTVRTLRLRRDIGIEIAIVGGGISGALAALTLAGAGHAVAVLDRRPPGAGSTAATTAMIQFEIDTPLVKLARKIGCRKAERAYLRSAQAVEDLGQLLSSHGIDGRWRPRSSLYLAGDATGFRGLQKEAEARQRIGLPSVYLDRAAVNDQFAIDVTGALHSDGAAELDPAMTSAGCLVAAQRLGARVYSPCDVVDVAAEKGRLVLATADGPRITASKVVFATGYETVQGVPRDAFDIVSSWAIATKPIAPERFWQDRCLIWEASDPYLYLRSTVDHRIVGGGEDSGLRSAARRARAVPLKSRKILRKVGSLLGLEGLEVDYAWAGAFAESPTGLPVFTPLAHLPGAFAILGCGGNGITFSVIAAQFVRSWVAGKPDRDADIFITA